MIKPGLDAAYGLQTPEDNLRLYRDWAETYDSGFASDHGYVLPLRVAEGFAAAAAAAGGTGPVLDLGAGTGLCGEALRRLGVTPIDATDLSAEMLAVARRKAVYRDLFIGDMLDRLPVADGTYAGAVSSGTFTHGHVGPEALNEVVRVLRPGGLACLSVNAAHYAARGFDVALEALIGQIDALRLTEVNIYAKDHSSAGTHSADTALIVVFRRV